MRPKLESLQVMNVLVAFGTFWIHCFLSWLGPSPSWIRHSTIPFWGGFRFVRGNRGEGFQFNSDTLVIVLSFGGRGERGAAFSTLLIAVAAVKTAGADGRSLAVGHCFRRPDGQVENLLRGQHPRHRRLLGVARDRHQRLDFRRGLVRDISLVQD